MSLQNNKDVTTTESRLIEKASLIGSIAEKNGQFTHGLALRLFRLEKPFELLTIAELIEQINIHVKSYNAVFGGET